MGTWATGGYTGDGGKFTPAGIVHKGEYVITKEATSRIGLDYLNYLNYGRRGFASGGGVAVPRVPSQSYMPSSQQNVTVTVVNNGKPVESEVSTEQKGNELALPAETDNARINVDYLNHATSITMASYVSKEKKDEGKEQLSINTFTISNVPDWSQVPYEWALGELIKAQPEDFVPESYYGYVNPYLFAGGKIKDTVA